MCDIFQYLAEFLLYDEFCHFILWSILHKSKSVFKHYIWSNNLEWVYFPCLLLDFALKQSLIQTLVIFCSLVGLLSLWHNPNFHFEFYLLQNNVHAWVQNILVCLFWLCSGHNLLIIQTSSGVSPLDFFADLSSLAYLEF